MVPTLTTKFIRSFFILNFKFHYAMDICASYDGNNNEAIVKIRQAINCNHSNVTARAKLLQILYSEQSLDTVSKSKTAVEVKITPWLIISHGL